MVSYCSVSTISPRARISEIRDTLPAHGVERSILHRAVALSGEPLDLVLQKLDLVQDHGQRIVDLVGEADGHLAQGGQLVLAQDLAQVLGEADRAVLFDRFSS